MPATVQWDETHPGTISITYTGNWTWDEFYNANKDAKQLMESVTERVDVVVDMQQGRFPSSGPAIGAARNVFKSWPSNYGTTVIVAGSFISALVGIFKHVDNNFGPTVSSAKSVDEAHALVQRERAAQTEPA
jgi:hypothetical protein